MRRKPKGKALFVVGESKQDTSVQVKPKRGRPKKNQVEPVTPIPKKEKRVKKEKVPETVVKEVKKRGRPKKNPNPVEVETPVPQESPWKDFNTSKPALLQPVEFYVDTGKEKKDIFRGFIQYPGFTATDEPYKMCVLRKKYGNLWYREIEGCVDVSNCPDNFPHCDRCKRRNK